jgi:general secretion pathway protein L
MQAFAELRATVGGAIQQAVTWWLDELAALIPRRFTNRPESASAILDLSAREATLALAARGAAPAVRIPLGGADPLQDRIHVQAAIRQRPARTVVVRLDRSLVLEASVTLPLAAERSLRKILLHQLDRLVPLPSDAVEFQYLVTERSPANKTIVVRLIVATRASIERAVTVLQTVGLKAGMVIAPSGVAGDDAMVTLWRANQERMASPAMRWLRHGLEAAAVVLFIAAYGTYVVRLNAYRDQLQEDVAIATRASAAARTLIAQSAQTESALTLLQRRQREMNPLLLLDELTKLVPETTWVSQLSIRGRNVELIGYGPRVGDLITRIQDHEIFYDPKFRSPITMSPDGKGERFDVSFDIWIEDKP